ncbi:MAG: DoxX family protein [Gemmatimonadota bacterium]|nr:DoxX family protein [Gemmatimonadota bacterium]
MIWNNRYTPYALALLRIAAAIVIAQHGAQKLFGVLGGAGGNPGQSSIDAGNWLMAGVGVLECGGSLLIAIGLWTRPIAFLLSGEMAVAYFWRHTPRGFWPVVNKGEPAALLSFIFLFLAAAGPGAWSVDEWMRARKELSA